LLGLAVMTAVLFLLFAAAAAPSPILPALESQWHFSSWLLGLAFATYALAVLAALLTVGRLSDHLGRRPVVLASTAVELIAMLGFLVADNIWVFVVARALQGLATGGVTGAISAAIADYAGERGARLTATLSSVAPLAGLASGAIFSGVVSDLSSSPKRDVFAAFATFCVSALIAVTRVAESSSKQPGALQTLWLRVAVPPAARRAFWSAMPVAVAVWMAGGLYLSVVGETARVLLDVRDQFAVSLLIAGLSATGALAVLVTRGWPLRRTVPAGTLLIALGMSLELIAVERTSTAALIIATVLSGIGFGTAFAGAVGLVVPHARPHERAELFSAIYVVNYLAFGLPAIAAGFLIRPWGLSTAVLAYTALIGTIAVLATITQLMPHLRRQLAHPRAKRPVPMKDAR
jgi:MFS family permease